MRLDKVEQRKRKTKTLELNLQNGVQTLANRYSHLRTADITRLSNSLERVEVLSTSVMRLSVTIQDEPQLSGALTRAHLLSLTLTSEVATSSSTILFPVTLFLFSIYFPLLYFPNLFTLSLYLSLFFAFFRLFL